MSTEKTLAVHEERLEQHSVRLESVEGTVKEHEKFHSWFEKEGVAKKITGSYNLLIGLIFMQGGVMLLGVIIAIKKGLF